MRYLSLLICALLVVAPIQSQSGNAIPPPYPAVYASSLFTGSGAVVDPTPCMYSGAPTWCNVGAPNPNNVTAETWLNNVCNLLPQNGGIVDLRNFGYSTQTLAARVTNCSNKQVFFWGSHATTWNITATDANTTICLPNGGGYFDFFTGPLGNGAGGGFKVQPGAHIRSIFGPCDESGNQETMYVIGANVVGNALSTVDKALIFADRVFTPSAIMNNTASQCQGICYLLENIGGQFTFANNWGNAAGGTGGAVTGSTCVIQQDSTFQSSDINFIGNTCEHANGAGNYDFAVLSDGTGINLNMHIQSLYNEVISGTGTVQPTTDILLQNCEQCTLENVRGNTPGTYVTVSQTGAGGTKNTRLFNLSDFATGSTVVNDTVDTGTNVCNLTNATNPIMNDCTVAPGFTFFSSLNVGALNAISILGPAGSNFAVDANAGENLCLGVGSLNCSWFVDSSFALNGPSNIKITGGRLFAPAYVSNGTQTIAGCSLSSATGGEMSGKFTSGTAGACTVTVTPGFTATNGFYCSGNDLTTPADKIQQTATTTTTATISGTTALSDIVTWACNAY